MKHNIIYKDVLFASLRNVMENLKEKTEWNLTLLFNGDDDSKIQEKRKKVEEKTDSFVNKWKNREDYLKEPEKLREALDDYDNLQMNSVPDGDGAGTDEAFYFWLRIQQDQNDTILKGKYNQAQDFVNKIINRLRFFKLNIAKINSDLYLKFLNYPNLKKYNHFLERLFAESKYLLSENEEKIISLKQSPAQSNWENMVSGFLSKEEREVLNKKGEKELKNFSEIISLLNSEDKNVRDSSALVLNEILSKHCDSAEAELNSILANKKIDDELRKVERADFIRHLSDDIDSSIVDTMIDSVSSNVNISKRYYQLKSKLFGVPKLKYHERNVQYGEIEKKHIYSESVNLIYSVFNNLDNKFLSIAKKLVENGQIDVYPKKGKRSGAFCTDSNLSQPVYVLLNHTDKLNDVLTIAHELGHAINFELMKERLDSLNCGMVLSTAEVASTFMEDFVLQELLKESDDELRLSILMMKLDDDISTIFRQTACYKFEQELHSTFREKGYLSKEEIGRIFQRHMMSYMGDFVEQSNGSENWWIHWRHIRRFFYVYSYASGLLISKSLQKSVKNNPRFINKVKDFLSAGTSDSPKNIFAKLGIDITNKGFWDSGIKEIEELLSETEKLAKKLGKI